MECVCNTIGTKIPIGNGEEYMGMIVTIQNRLVHNTHKNKWNDHFRRLEMPAVISPRNTQKALLRKEASGSCGPKRCLVPTGPRHLRRPRRVRSASLFRMAFPSYVSGTGFTMSPVATARISGFLIPIPELSNDFREKKSESQFGNYIVELPDFRKISGTSGTSGTR